MTTELEIYSDFNCTWCYFDKPAVTKLKKEYDIHIACQAVDKDWEESEDAGIMVAPTYILNQDKLMGSQSYEALETLMQSNGIEKRG